MKDAEKQIAELEKRRDTIRADLAEAGSDHVELARLGTAEAETSAELTEAEDRWMALAEEAESLR